MTIKSSWCVQNEPLRNICNQLQDETGLHSPSHHDLLRDLVDPAILGYLEDPETTQTAPHSRKSITSQTAADRHSHRSQSIQHWTCIGQEDIGSKRNKPKKENTPEPPLSLSCTRPHRDTRYTHSLTSTRFHCLSQLAIKADALSIKTFFPSLAVLHLGKAEAVWENVILTAWPGTPGDPSKNIPWKSGYSSILGVACKSTCNGKWGQLGGQGRFGFEVYSIECVSLFWDLVGAGTDAIWGGMLNADLI